MGWRFGIYYYAVGTLYDIAQNLACIYTDWAKENNVSPMSAAEYRADFYIALKKLPPQMKKAINNYILGGREDWETKRNRREGFRMMKRILNGEAINSV